MIGRSYREVLRLTGVRPLLTVALLARIPIITGSIALTLYVVLGLGGGYAAAGLVGAAMTIGAALGGPLLGRLIDRRGLRPVLLLTTVAEAIFWAAVPAMSYPVLLVCAVLGGLLAVPVFATVRQSLAALVPVGQRRQAYALDSMSVELAFMTGPALGVLLATAVSAWALVAAVGVGVVASGVALFLLNPPIRGRDEPTPAGRRPPRREWLTGRLVAVLALTVATTLVVGGTDVAVVAVLRESGQLAWTGAVLSLWGAYSLVGGFSYGATRRPLAPLSLTVLLCLTTVPVGFAGERWWLLALALVPAGLLCAPSIAASADAVSRLAPARVRGEAMGLHGSALTVGLAVGAPLAGAVVDATSPAWGFAATGLAGALLALTALPVALSDRRPDLPEDAQVPTLATLGPTG